MLLSTVYVLVAFIAFSQAQVIEFGKCPTEIPVEKDFDDSMFAGVWYEQKHTLRFNPFEALVKCVKYDFSDAKHGVINLETLKVSSVFNDKHYQEKTFRPQEGGHYDSSNYDYRVSATDYTTYAIIYGCANNLLTHSTLVWILSRDRVMSLDVDAVVTQKLKDLNIPSDNLMKTVQTNCD